MATASVLKAAKAKNSALKIFASPWTPPAWMKTNNSLYGGKLSTNRYSDYANYLVKYAHGPTNGGCGDCRGVVTINSVAQIALNAGSAAKTFTVRSNGQSFNTTLPAGAVATYKWAG